MSTRAALLEDLRKMDVDLTRWRISAARMIGASPQGQLQASERVRFLEIQRSKLADAIAALKAST